MKVKIILDGEIRSCCSSYPPELVREIVQSWLGDQAELEVIDKNQGNFQPDRLVELAEKYFGSAIYPLVYVGDKIATIGDIPDEQTLRDILEGKVEYGVTEEDILEEARRHGLVK
ncbi:MAG: hypothetical protein ACPLRX_01895 [Candidatus Saccharicenans sp.]